MRLERTMDRVVLATLFSLSAALVVGGCQDRDQTGAQRTPPAASDAVKTSPATTPPATPAPTTSSSDPVVVPGKGTDVVEQKGTETGMVGGASGPVASGGKPGSGTESGAGTGPAQSSGDKVENKK